MSAISRKLLAGTAATALITLTACGGNDVASPPALAEIEDSMWEAMAQQDSVTVSADVDLLTDGNDAEIMTEMFGADEATVTVYGDLDGSSTGMGMGQTDLIRVFDQEEAYLAGGAIFEIFGGGAMDEEQAALDAMGEELSGVWVDYSDELDAEGDDFNIGGLFAELEENWYEPVEDNDQINIRRDQIQEDAVHEVRDEVDVWVYPGEQEGQELILEADHDAPKLLGYADDEMTITFSDWGTTESPERPDESDVITEEEFEERLMQAMFGAAMDGLG